MRRQDTDVCACGHVRDEHGGDPDHPGSTACTVEGYLIKCDCIAFEYSHDMDDEEPT